MSDANAHANHPDAVTPNCVLSARWTRDPLDGKSLAVFLDQLAERRGVAHVAEAAGRWLEGRALREPSGKIARIAAHSRSEST